MMINIHEIKLDEKTEYILDCPVCKCKFKCDKNRIKSAKSHKQKYTFCSKDCIRESRQVSKEELINRIKKFYKAEGRIPTFKDFKLSSMYPRKFGNWTNALKESGFEPVCRVKKENGKTNPNNWARQRERHIRLKKHFVAELGGKCNYCGYAKNLAALQFHHIEEKTIALDARSLGNISESRLRKELDKCLLLCANCHFEFHNPDLNL